MLFRSIGKWLGKLSLTRLQPRPYHPKKDYAAEDAMCGRRSVHARSSCATTAMTQPTSSAQSAPTWRWRDNAYSNRQYRIHEPASGGNQLSICRSMPPSCTQWKTSGTIYAPTSFPRSSGAVTMPSPEPAERHGSFWAMIQAVFGQSEQGIGQRSTSRSVGIIRRLAVAQLSGGRGRQPTVHRRGGRHCG